jgi:acetolactate synthase small subunit
MKAHTVRFISLNSPVLIGRFMLLFSRRKIEVTNFSFKKLSEEEGEFSIEFLSDDWMAENIEKQLNKQIDIYEAFLTN